MTDAELQGFCPDRYFARSWALLTRDRGWVKPVLALCAALFVPIVGPIGVLGYVLEWARLTAWGVASSPKQKRVRVGECIVSGFRAFVVLFVWSLCCSLIGALLALVPLLGSLAAFAWSVFSMFIGVLSMIAALRATIYQSVTAGLDPKATWEMAKRDVSGLVRVFGILAAGTGIMFCAIVAGSVLMVLSILPQVISFGGYIELYDSLMTDAERMRLFFEMVASFVGVLGVILVGLVLVVSVITIVMSMLGYTALGLWLRQFNVAAWGAEKDPLPAAAPHLHPNGPFCTSDMGAENASWHNTSPTPGPNWADDDATGPISAGDAPDGGAQEGV